ncbi:cupredoxin domain-containing protein [Calidifontibacillus erzurumensis]|uniref:Cytochrome aa3 subunit 2 n=1 Tax=Calidifontibacillus erzurumensis TaxID=2741433 RepID=A0A8J8GC25_9BACI|nr:cytochrome C oxidase subunit II [Calidifontibacillus erzurumensis]NSL50927.1 cytochrome C oxidase subunit II [Calidifontibacillus erzurumensis]
MYQQAAWFTTIIFIAGIIGVFLYIINNSDQKEDYGTVKHKGHQLQKFYFLALIVVFSIATVITLKDLPFERAKAQENQIIVDAIASQFAFELSQNEFEVGQPIEFRVTSKDVNHGFGIYDENMQLIAQTQAMPEYTNPIYITFTKPGTYKVLCLEYCGIAHHVMQATISVY